MGTSGDLERENAKILFSRSIRSGFRYVEYISDGDLRVVSTIRELKPYGEGVTLQKTECANHLTKRSRARLAKWGTNWTLAHFEERDEKRQKKLDDKEKKDAAA